jgi:outer membrane autotransporter protein
MYRWRIIPRAGLMLCGIVATAVGLPDPVQAQSAAGLPLPPGSEIVLGPVFRRDGSSVPGVATGADANTYIFSVPPTQAFLNPAPAVAILTTEPSQFVRFYTAGITRPVGGFIAGSNAVRGLTPSQVRNVLALPYLPDSYTIVQVPAGTCMLVGTAAPITGHFAAKPPSIPTPGPWGSGGVIQNDLIGLSSSPGCAHPAFLPAGDYINQQPIGAYALSYRPRAVPGNSYNVAQALDLATPPPLYSDMDSIYNALDVLNYGDPAPLRAALVQLDGEVYADVPSVEIAVGQMFLGVLRDQMHLLRGSDGARPGGGAATTPAGAGTLREWFSGFGGAGFYNGTGNGHDVNFNGGGIAAGAEYHFNPSLLAGVSLAYARSGFSTSGISGDGSLNTFALGLYGSYQQGAAYLDGVLGYTHSGGNVDRAIVFPGVTRFASGSPNGNGFLSNVEAGYHIPLIEHTVLTPLAALQGIVAWQPAFTETGAGAIDLAVQNDTTASVRSILGAELGYDMTLGLSAPLRLTGRAGWAYEFASANRTVTAGFVGLPGVAFAASGAPVPRNAGIVGLAAELAVQPVTLFARYDATLASGSTIQAGTVGLRVSF